MRVLVTGASGFLGRPVVAALAGAGHHVVALVRPTASADDLRSMERVEVVAGDLRRPHGLAAAVGDVAAVVHLAAAASGGFAEQFEGTVVGTERLLAQLDLHRLDRFVHVSSFSVYDYDALDRGATLDEASPLDREVDERDPYTTTKLIQERLVREACAESGVRLAVLRPGAIFGPGKDWAYGAGLRLGRASLVIAPGGRFRLTFVDNCADAIARAVDAPLDDDVVVNIVDDDLPTNLGLIRRARRSGADVGWIIPIPWIALVAVGRLVQVVDSMFFGGRARLPEVLSRPRARVRWLPLRYPNRLAKDRLGWTPRVGLDGAIMATVDGAPEATPGRTERRAGT